MKVITEPSVYLVSKPQISWGEVQAFLEDQGYPSLDESLRARGADSGTLIMEMAARLCYASYGKGRKDIAPFVKNIISSKHGSVLEHVNYGFIFTGVSRSLTHELVRHRAGFAYSQRSQRYVDESDLTIVAPPFFLESQQVDQLTIIARELENDYKRLTELLDESMHVEPSQVESPTDRRKAIRQAARAVLPNMTETQIYVTGNVRAWRHYVELRASVHADTEIRRLAFAVGTKLKHESPLLFADFEPVELPDGTWGWEVEHSKI